MTVVTPRSPTTQSAVDELYRVFKPYRASDSEITEGDIAGYGYRDIIALPLRELSVDQINRYARKAMTAWGTLQGFKHFLPRLLEIALDDYLEFTMPEGLLGKLAYAQWTEWPPVERDAVTQFLEAFWRHQLAMPLESPGDDRIMTVLGGLAEAEGSVAKYLTLWESALELAAALHLAALINQVTDEVVTSQTIRLWSPSDRVGQELMTWFASEVPRQILEPHREKISQVFPAVFGDVEMLRAAVGRKL